MQKKQATYSISQSCIIQKQINVEFYLTTQKQKTADGYDDGSDYLPCSEEAPFMKRIKFIPVLKTDVWLNRCSILLGLIHNKNGFVSLATHK